MNPLRAVPSWMFPTGTKMPYQSEGSYRNFLANHNLETTWTGCTSSPSTWKYDAFVVVLTFNAVRVTLE